MQPECTPHKITPSPPTRGRILETKRVCLCCPVESGLDRETVREIIREEGHTPPLPDHAYELELGTVFKR